MASKKTILILTCLSLACTFIAPSSAAPDKFRPTIDLDGEWNFATDPDDVGEKEQWFLADKPLPKIEHPGYAPGADGKIIVPGSWDAQGYGPPIGIRFHRFLGKGWYRKTVKVPADWEGKSIYLTIGGVHRRSKAWVNGKLLGEHIGYLSALEYEVTSVVEAGKEVVIVIQVDSRRDMELDPFWGTIDGVIKDNEWGGIWGHVGLEARREAYIDDVWVQTTSIASPEIKVNIQLDGDELAQANHASIRIVDGGDKSIAEAQALLSEEGNEKGRLAVSLKVPEAKLWSLDHPNLYTAKVSLIRDGEEIDQVAQQFGVREFKTDGQYFLLNGKRVFLAGAGDDNIYPEDFGALFVAKDKLIHRAKLMKTYGFNAIRTHTATMSPEFYDVCDELGLLVRAELPFIGSPALDKAGSIPAYEKTAKSEYRKAIIRHRNHPSLYSWSLGNELRTGRDARKVEIASEYKAILDEFQPESLFVDGANTAYYKPGPDGVNVHYNVIEELDRDNLDYSSPVQYSEGPPYEFGGVAFDQSGNKNQKPAVIHESGEFVTYPNLEDRHQFTHSIRAVWLEKMAEGYKTMGLAAENALWSEISEKLYLDCQKLEMENIRLQDAHAGYDFWLFQDYWETGNGVMTHYLKPKEFVPVEKFRAFNDSQTVLLKKDLELTYRGGDPLTIDFLVWHYAPDEIADATFTYSMKCGDEIIATKTVDAVSATAGDVSSIASEQVVLPEATELTQILITAKLTCGDRIVENEWTANLFPKTRTPVVTSVPVFAPDSLAANLSHYHPSAIPSKGPLSAEAIYIVDQLDERLVAALSQGAKGILIHPKDEVFPAYTIMRWRSAYWSGNFKRRSVGHLLYDHPLTRAITADNWFSHEWWYLFEDSRSYYINRLPPTPNVLIRNIDGPPAVANKSLLFEAQVGKGYLLVSGLNHLNHTDRPEVQWVMDKMVGYAAADPQPKAQISPAFLRKQIASAKEDTETPEKSK